MRVIIVHHHLHTGGVTKVIQTQVQALKQAGVECECIVGELPEFDLGIKLHHLPNINYLLNQDNSEAWNEQLEDIKASFKRILSDKQSSIIHVHNLNLGKNPLVTLAIQQLAKEGYAVVNHCHDFAEDDRPKNMELLNKVIAEHFGKNLEEVMYPKLQNYKFATINSKDRERLLKKSYQESEVLFLANAIAKPNFEKREGQGQKVRQDLGIMDDKPMIVYPVRAILRKNIGEFILIASLFSDRAHWLITQAPKNPVELENYNEWLSFCTKEKNGVIFEAGQKTDFNNLMASADRMISTSIAEGFGLSFLEPWLYGKPVVGRDIPEITADFSDQDINLKHLYSSIPDEDGIDFASLEESEKQEMIHNILHNDEVKKAWQNKAEFQFLFQAFAEDEISHNAKKIEEHYSLTSYGHKLREYYGTF